MKIVSITYTVENESDYDMTDEVLHVLERNFADSIGNVRVEVRKDG